MHVEFELIVISLESFWNSKTFKATCCSLWPPASLCLFVSLRAIMVCHKEFQNAGKQPGLQVWRIENLDLKPIPKSQHGSFYSGDAYVLLFTTSAPSYNIHMWLGKLGTHMHSFKECLPFNDFKYKKGL